VNVLDSNILVTVVETMMMIVMMIMEGMIDGIGEIVVIDVVAVVAVHHRPLRRLPPPLHPVIVDQLMKHSC